MKSPISVQVTFTAPDVDMTNESAQISPFCPHLDEQHEAAVFTQFADFKRVFE